jgi:hypothetical protein
VVVFAWTGVLALAAGGTPDGVPAQRAASEVGRLALVVPALVVVAAILVHAASARLSRPLGRVVWVAASAAALAIAARGGGRAAALVRTYDEPVAAVRAGVRAEPALAPLVDDVVAWIARAAPPATPVPVWPSWPTIGFLAGRDGAAGFHVVEPGQPSDRDARIIADLDARPTEAIVFGFAADAPVAAFRGEAPALYQHLVRRWEIVEVFGREIRGPVFAALRRRPLHPPLGAPILTHLPRQGRLWPFADVLMVPVGLPESPPVVATAMPFPEVKARMVFRYGVNPARWHELPPGPFTFEVHVEGERAWSATLDPTARLADRRWVPGEVDLGRFAGKPLGEFAFRVTAPRAVHAPDDLAGFENPRIDGE